MNVHLLKFLLLFFSSLWTPHAQHVETRNCLKPGKTLNSSSRLVSPNGMFVLRWSTIFVLTNGTYLCTEHMGFGTGSSYTIWFTSSVITTANDSNMITLVNDAGALKIRCPDAEPIKLCSSGQPTNNIVASLLDSGNFIFQEVYSNGSTKWVIWQTFNHPRQRLLLGMKLGVNHKTGQTWSLSSWLTGDIFGVPGSFNLKLDPKGRQLII